MADNMQQASQWGLEVNPTDRWETLHYKSLEDLHSIPQAELEHIAIDGIRSRFAELRPQLPMLDRLADEQGVTEIFEVNDAAKLLFQHSVYKSYPVSFVEKAQFDRLTKWLGGLTTVDLSQLDLNGIETIDDWIDLLDAETPIRIVHSSGTSGKLSFLPRSTKETDLMVQGWRLLHEDAFAVLGADAPKLDEVPIIYPGYRTAAMAQQRMLNRIVESVFSGDRTMLIALNENRMSADAVSLGGRLQVGSQKGERGEVRLSPTLLARRDELIRSMTEAPNRMADFIAGVAKSHAGRSVAMLSMVGQLYNIAKAATSNGLSRVFSPHSNIMFGGGWKGATPPENWEAAITEFLGVEDLRMGYGMTECIAATRSCEHGHYHLYPFHIPFLLDPVTGHPYPRHGTQTGRLGVFDLGATTYWGGFLSGDKVTLSYDACACGRTTPTLLKDSISRYTEEEGGDDKINCAGAPEAHENALAYLLASAEN
ncbi:phenylacetate--CoA ligase family protein [Rhizorhabdus argentea]|uniref:hypothetical protein n=1 Tax=Rhizorhabdus argentea TaxID=1387174 RepID=UPI0030EF1E04